MTTPELKVSDFKEKELQGKKIYLICPVRLASFDIQQQINSLVSQLESSGAKVHYPPRDVEQNDYTGGYNITFSHLEAMREADEVWIVWNPQSYGSHVDLGMAVALRKKLRLVGVIGEDTQGKSYLKVIQEIVRRQ